MTSSIQRNNGSLYYTSRYNTVLRDRCDVETCVETCTGRQNKCRMMMPNRPIKIWEQVKVRYVLLRDVMANDWRINFVIVSRASFPFSAQHQLQALVSVHILCLSRSLYHSSQSSSPSHLHLRLHPRETCLPLLTQPPGRRDSSHTTISSSCSAAPIMKMSLPALKPAPARPSLPRF